MGDFDGYIDEGNIWSKLLSSTEDDLLWNGGAGAEMPIFNPAWARNSNQIIEVSQ